MSILQGFWSLSLWLAATAIILLITLELLSPYYENINIYINKKGLRNITAAVSVLFLATVAARIIDIILVS